MKNTFYNFLYHSHITRIVDKFRSQRYCAILAYHRVRPFADSNMLMQEMIVEPEQFDWQMQNLRENFNVISLAELQQIMEKGEAFTENVAVVTFDDAYRDNLEYAVPILEKYEIPATIFVPTAYIESERVFWWDLLANILKMGFGQTIDFEHGGKRFCFRIYESRTLEKAFHRMAGFVKTLSEEGRQDFFKKLCLQTDVDIDAARSGCRALLTWEDMKSMDSGKTSFGAHTHTHCISSHCSLNQLKEEFVVSKEVLEKNLGRKVVHFAFPYGEQSDFNAESELLLKEAGYALSVIMEQGLVYPSDNLFQLKRVGIGGYDTEETFSLKISGVIPWLNRIKSGVC